MIRFSILFLGVVVLFYSCSMQGRQKNSEVTYPRTQKMGVRDGAVGAAIRSMLNTRKSLWHAFDVSNVDEQIGGIDTLVNATVQVKNTHIVFTSDHGLSVRSHGLKVKKDMFDHNRRVPCIVVWPRIPENEKQDKQVYFKDLAERFTNHQKAMDNTLPLHPLHLC